MGSSHCYVTFSTSTQLSVHLFQSLVVVLETAINEFIQERLKQDFGEKDWWRTGIPISIQKKCAEVRIENGTDEPDWHFLTTIQYYDIANNQWKLFEPYFTPPGSESMAKAKKLDWLKKFNSIRQKYSHPQREHVTEEEYLYLVELSEWLSKKLVL